jgi:hypothetical protein
VEQSHPKILCFLDVENIFHSGLDGTMFANNVNNVFEVLDIKTSIQQMIERDSAHCNLAPMWFIGDIVSTLL